MPTSKVVSDSGVDSGSDSSSDYVPSSANTSTSSWYDSDSDSPLNVSADLYEDSDQEVRDSGPRASSSIGAMASRVKSAPKKIVTYNQLHESSPRPDWAGVVTVQYAELQLPGTLADQRNKIGKTGKRPDPVRLPVMLSGIILPVRTTDRVTPNVEQRDLKHRPEDRGHLLACSLGAPNTTDIMVVQSRDSNQKVSVHSGFPGELDWRGTEVFLAAAASKVMEIGEDGLLASCFTRFNGASKARDVFDRKVTIAGAHGNYRVDGAAVKVMDPTSVPSMKEPRFHLVYEIRPEYGRNSVPISAQLDVFLCERDNESREKVISKNFDWGDTDEAQDRHIDRLEKKMEDKAKIAKRKAEVVAQRKIDHPTRSVTGTLPPKIKRD